MGGRGLNKLTDAVLRRVKEPGWYADGAGLYLRVLAGGAKRWVFVFRWAGKRAEMGLGAFPDVGVAEARDGPFGRSWAREQVRAGKNPATERRRIQAEERARVLAESKRQTFGEWAEEIAPAIGPRATAARKAWVAMMQAKTGDLAAIPPDEIQTEHVLKALKPYWLSRPESGRRMRQRIEKVLDAAKARGLIADPAWQNPARLKGHLENLLERRVRVVRHRAALPYEEAPAFVAELRQLDRLAARALEFAILSAARNIECRGARVGEIDRAELLWTIPAARMKGPLEARRPHRVPLTPRMVEILDEVVPPGADPAAFIFPCAASRTGMFSENALQNVINDMGLKGRATAHGFRSTFKDWANDTTNFPNEVIELALAHKVEDETERAYRRGDALLKRRKLMETWDAYLSAPPAAASVTPLSRRA